MASGRGRGGTLDNPARVRLFTTCLLSTRSKAFGLLASRVAYLRGVRSFLAMSLLSGLEAVASCSRGGVVDEVARVVQRRLQICVARGWVEHFSGATVSGEPGLAGLWLEDLERLLAPWNGIGRDRVDGEGGVMTDLLGNWFVPLAPPGIYILAGNVQLWRAQVSCTEAGGAPPLSLFELNRSDKALLAWVDAEVFVQGMCCMTAALTEFPATPSGPVPVWSVLAPARHVLDELLGLKEDVAALRDSVGVLLDLRRRLLLDFRGVVPSDETSD